MKKNKKNNKQITQGGFTLRHEADIVLQMPELFHFDLAAYMSAINAASSIDYSQRTRLYDMYESALLDLHLSGVLAKRTRAVKRLPIEFQRDGQPDERINEQLASPWFKRFREDVLMSHFWGFSLFQFYLDQDGYINYNLIPRKHFDPIKQQILKFQGDQSGIPLDTFPNTLFVGDPRSLGIFAKLLPAVLYKRGNIADWARFCNIFGIPIREYTYDAGDEEARRRLIADARRQGSNTVYIHPKESSLNLLESGNKSGSSELFRTFNEYWDKQISINVLGNTLTTDAQETGTQALGTVHQEEENEMNQEDREFILDILNYNLTDIFAALGFNTEGGKFVYAANDKINASQHINIVSQLNAMGLPMDHDYLYETFAIRKPDNYDEIIADKEAQKAAMRAALTADPNDGNDDPEDSEDPEDSKATKDPKDPKDPKKEKFKQSLRRFFGLAPQDHGADSNDW